MYQFSIANVLMKIKRLVTPNVQESNRVLGQIVNTQEDPLGPLGSHPSKALAREDLPEPVGPTSTIFGLGSSVSKSCSSAEATERMVITNRDPVGAMVLIALSISWRPRYIHVVCMSRQFPVRPNIRPRFVFAGFLVY